MSDILPPTPDAVRDWMLGYISNVLGMPREVIPIDARFETFGFDSAEAVIMAGVIEEEFDIEADPAVFFDQPSITAIAAIVARLAAEQRGGAGGAPAG